MTIQPLEQRHYEAVREIYEQGIETKLATFETSSSDWNVWDEKTMKACRIVAVDNEEVIGWAALTAVSSRCVYEGVAEVSVYIHENSRGQGLGKNLLRELIHASELEDIWTLTASIFPENKASVKIHLDLGFEELGTRKRIAKLDGEWRDTVLLERRSEIAGR